MNFKLIAIMRTLLFLTIFMLQKLICMGQDTQWWNNKHNWDGITPWSDYIIASSKFMGPNALPVPTINNGTISQNAYFNFGVNSHFSKGDNTVNLHTECYFPLFNPRVGLHIEIVPIEYYKMDTLTRDIRAAFNKNGEGFAGGDFYIGTHIQLLENKGRFPDILLTINIKTASGNKLASARFTDTPGYYFDLSFGKKISLNRQNTFFVKPYSMLGFYVWQLHGKSEMQNDALLYGLGVDLFYKKLEIRNSLGGYYGYIGNGDRPLVYRIVFRSTFDKVFNYEVKYQKGLNDFNYNSIMLSISTNLTRIKSNSTMNTH